MEVQSKKVKIELKSCKTSDQKERKEAKTLRRGKTNDMLKTNTEKSSVNSLTFTSSPEQEEHQEEMGLYGNCSPLGAFPFPISKKS